MKYTSGHAVAITALGLAFTTLSARAQETSGLSPATRENADIVVTAQRREERLADVPISVTALGADTLQKNVIISTADLTASVPGLNWGRSTNFSQVTIRGIGSRNVSSGDEPNVATFMDGVYLPDPTGMLFELANIERIEVLRGPQGTLFGRNATGGAISIVTKRPTSTFQGAASATAGEFGYYRLSGYVSGPIAGDVLTGSLSGVTYDDDGYIKNVYTGDKQGQTGGTVFRLRLRFEPASNFSIEVNGLHSRSHSNVLSSQYSLDGNTQARNAIPGGPNAAALNPTNIPASQIIADRPWTTATVGMPFGKTYQRFVDGHLSWDLDFATLSAQASVGATTTRNENWTDNSPIQLSHVEYNSLNEWSNQELVLTSNGSGPFTWLVGVTGFQSDAEYDPLRSTGRNAATGAFTPTLTHYGQNTRAFAAFGELTWEPVKSVFLTGGLRYNRDDKTAFNVNLLTNASTRGSARFENVSPRGVARWEFEPNSNVYFSYTRGFKSGVFNAVAAAGTQLPARPEIVDAYELGVKARLAPGISLEGAAFHYDYSDLQVSTPVVINGISATTVQNAGTAKINGIEGTLTAEVTRNLSFYGTVAVLDTKMHDFPNASVQVPRTDASGVPTNNGNLNVVLDVSGNELIRAPKYTFSVGATYRHDLFGGEISANANAFFSGRYFFDLTNRLSQPAYEIVNASVTWRQKPDRGGFYASVFAQNLTDQVYAAGFIISSFIDASQANKPRWFGGTIGYEF